MGSIECQFIGEQAKKLREAAGLSLEQLIDGLGLQLSVEDFKNFENGELYSTRVIQTLYDFYFTSIDNIYIKQGKSFLTFLDSYCDDNDLSKNALIESYLKMKADASIANLNKNDLADLIKILFKRSDYLQENTNTLTGYLKYSMDQAQDIIKSFRGEKEAWRNNMHKLEILTTAIILSDLKNKVVEEIKNMLEEEREYDFCEYDEQTYLSLIKEIEAEAMLFETSSEQEDL